MHAAGHLMTQAARTGLHAAPRVVQKLLVAAGVSSPCQVTLRHDSGAAS